MKAHEEIDRLHRFGDGKASKQREQDWFLRTLRFECPDDVIDSVQIRPYTGSVDVRVGHQSVNIDARAIPAVIKALRAAAKEALS